MLEHWAATDLLEFELKVWVVCPFWLVAFAEELVIGTQS